MLAITEEGKSWSFLCEAAQGNPGALQPPEGARVPGPRTQSTEQTTKPGRWKIPSGILPRYPGRAGARSAGCPQTACPTGSCRGACPAP